MSEAPKLYVNKPKKGQLKQLKMEAQPSSSASAAAQSPSVSSYYSTGSSGGGVSKPPEVPKESFARRYKFIWPLLLTVNLAVGAYLFMRTKKKDVAIEEEISSAALPPPTPNATATAIATPAAVTESLPVAQPMRVSEPIPEQRQRELFKWMLEEKRKIKSTDPEEKKRIDEEKAILKQFIRAKTIPRI